MALEVAPLVADGAQRALLPVLLDGHRLAERCLVVNIERDEHILVVEQVCHGGIAPHGGLHLATVDATKACEVDKGGLALQTCCRHACLIRGEARVNGVAVEVKVLCGDRRREGADGLERSTPQARHHVDGERQRCEGKEKLRHVGAAALVVMGEVVHAEQIEAQQREEHDPEGEEGLAVKDMPAVGQVGNRQKLEGERQLNEAQRHLYDVHPAARLGCRLEQRGEKGEQGEGYGKGQGEAEHADGGCHDGSLCAHSHEQEADDGTCA